jgi:hypothetical protein
VVYYIQKVRKYMKIKVSTRETEKRSKRWNRETFEYEPAKTRVYWWYRNDKTLDADAYKTLKKAVVTILTGFGHKIKTSDIKYSQYAGCTCGCSPGFILPVALGVDIFIDVTKR